MRGGWRRGCAEEITQTMRVFWNYALESLVILYLHKLRF